MTYEELQLVHDHMVSTLHGIDKKDSEFYDQTEGFERAVDLLLAHNQVGKYPEKRFNGIQRSSGMTVEEAGNLKF